MTQFIPYGDGHWMCPHCKGRDVCYCDEEFPEPICECGELGFYCRCDRDEYYDPRYEGLW